MSTTTTATTGGAITTLQQLLDVLAAQNVPHAVNTETRTVEIPARNPPLESVCYIRWEKELPYVQLICPLVLGAPPARHADLEAAICRANNALPLPGFGLDHERGTVYFRHTLAVYGEGVLPGTFQRLVVAVMNAARDFVIPFRAVVDGKPGVEILQAVVQKGAAAAGSAFKD